jgi:flagellar biosynthesis chaperone FliJ
MHEKYVTLFKELARTTAITAERVMDLNHEKGDEQGFKTAMTMRDDFEEIHDRIKDAGNNYQLGRNDAARLMVGALITINQMQNQINAMQKAIAGYQSDVIPKLQAIVDNAKSDIEANQLANEKFIIENEE